MKYLCRHGSWIGILAAMAALCVGVCAGKNEDTKSTEKTQISLAKNQSGWQPFTDARPGKRTSAEPASASAPAATGPVERFWHSASIDLNTLPDVVIGESVEIVSDWNKLFPLLVTGAASIVLHKDGTDKRFRSEVEEHHFLGKGMDEFTYTVGGPGFHFGAAGLWYAISAGKQDHLNKERAWTMLKALSITGAGTLTLKLLRDNNTPNEKWLAWPSGHTSSSFTVAAVLDEFYGPQVGIPAYLGAGFVGYRMMESGDHWLSDVIFGATLGYIVGHHVAGKDKKLQVAGFEVTPYMDILENDNTVMGVSFSRNF